MIRTLNPESERLVRPLTQRRSLLRELYSSHCLYGGPIWTMERILPVAAVALVTGCIVITQDLRAKSPDTGAMSAKPSREVAACITKRWEKSGAFGASMRVDTRVLADGYSISITTGTVVQLLADVRDSGTGSTTAYYKPAFVLATETFEAAIRDCQ